MISHTITWLSVFMCVFHRLMSSAVILYSHSFKRRF